MSEVPPEVLPVFPLPGLVFVPGQRLPLHIFEPRYRAMTARALRGDQWLCVSCAEPGAPDDAPLAPIATAGRIVSHQQLADGRYNILVEGEAKVSLVEVSVDTPWRQARAQQLHAPDEDEVPTADHMALIHVVGRLMRLVAKRGAALRVPSPSGISPARLAMHLVDRFIVEHTTRLEALHCERGVDLVRLTTTALSALLQELDPEALGDAVS